MSAGSTPHRHPGSSHANELNALTNRHFISLPVKATVGEAIKKVRRSANPGDIFYLYVVDETERLVGVVSIRNLLLAKDEDPVKSILSTHIVFISKNLPMRDIYRTFSESRFLSLPVVDESGKILGVLHAHELVEERGKALDTLFEERTRGELFELLGIKAEDKDRGALPTAVGRFPWLLINLIGGSLSALFIHYFGGKLSDAVLLLAFVPILQIISESVGMQTASVAIANLHRSSSRLRSRAILYKEFLVACCLGGMCALMVGLGVYAWKGSAPLSLTLAATIFLGTLGVSTLGNLIPFLIHRLRIDPRVSAGPVILAISDCYTLLLYLILAVGILR